MKQVGIALVGCGLVANVHIAAIKELAQAKICGVWSRDAEHTAIFAAKHELFAYESFAKLLADPVVDVVVLCTPPGSHVDLGLEVAQAKKHLVVEKPLDIDFAKAQLLVDTYQHKGLKLSVIFQNRFTPAAQMVKQALEDGLLGKLYLGDAYIKWYRSPEYYASAAWRGTWAVEGGGALINQGIHTIDLLQWLMGGVKTVSGIVRTMTHKIETEDIGVAWVDYHNGAVGVIEGSTAIQPSFKERVELHGENGTIILEGGNIKEWKVVGCNEADYVTVEKVSYGVTNSPAITPVNHKAQYADIIAAVQENREPLVNGEQGLKALDIVLGIYKSSQQGCKIEL